MRSVVLGAADVLIVCGVLITALALARRMRPVTAIAAGLEVWLAATLLRLAVVESWIAIGAGASLVVLRRVLVVGALRRAERRPRGRRS